MMRLHRLIVLESLQRLGLPGMAGIALIAFALIHALFVLRPAGEDRARMQERAELAEARMERVRSGGESLPEPPGQQLESFHQALTAQPEATQAIDRIYEAAARHSLSLARGEYALMIDADTGMARYQILLPVRGSYPQLRRFLGDALDAVPALGLEEIELQRKQISEAQLEGRIRMTLFLSRR